MNSLTQPKQTRRPNRRLRAVLIYALALVLPCLTLWLRFQIPVSVEEKTYLILFVPGLLVVGMLGGLRAGLLATAVTGLITNYYLLTPTGEFSIAHGHDLIQWGTLLLSGAMVSALAQWQRREQARAEAGQSALLATQARLDVKEVAEDSLRTLFNAVPDAILVSDVQGRIIQVNQRTEALFGYSEAQLLGQSIDILVPDRVRPGHADHRAAYIAAPAVRPMGSDTRLSARRRDGSEFPVSISLSPCMLGGQMHVISAVRDISALRQIETDLLLSRERLALTTDAAHMGIWDYNVVDGSLVWDDWMYRLYGVDRQNFSGAYAAWTQAVHPDDLPAAVALLQATIRGQAKFDTRFRIIRPDGAVRWIKAVAASIPDPQGKIIRITGANLDITDEVDIYNSLESTLEKLAASNRSLQVANKELESFSYSVSHDLRAPLRSIDGFSKILVQAYADKLDAQGQDFLKRMRAAAQRMEQLIDDMLVLAHISQTELVSQHFDLSALVETAIAQLREAYPERQIETVVQPDVQASGDPKLIRIVLDNLLGNAWKFTGKTEHARIEFGCVTRDGNTEFFVRDNGAGFDMAYANKLFGAFQRLHHVNDFPGSGIGLATVIRIIHKHGGDVRAEAAVGQGATFWFTLSA